MVASLREQIQELSLCRSFTLEKKIAGVTTEDRVRDDNLKRQIKNRTLYTFRLFLLTRIFQYNSDQKYLSIYPSYFFNIHRVIIFEKFPKCTIFQLIMEVYI